jgi:dihydroorotase
MAEAKQPPRPILFSGTRLIDPASGRDAPGDLLVADGRIAAIGAGLADKGMPEGTERVVGSGLCLAPGLVDLRVQLREPGEEHK